MATTPALTRTQSQNIVSLPGTPSPGSWRHPKFDEIARRQRANTFDDGNVRKIMYNGAALVAVGYAILHPSVSKHLNAPSISGIATPLSSLILAILAYNILMSFMPLIRTPDSIADIALTPTQRALLGLDPLPASIPTPGSTYITPPRYPHSPTTRSMSATPRSVSASSGTPSNRRNSLLAQPTTDRGDSPTASPLWNKTRAASRRDSQGSPGSLVKSVSGNGIDRNIVLGRPPSVSGTPSPTGGIGNRGSGVGLNNKWLYEKKGRRGSGAF